MKNFIKTFGTAIFIALVFRFSVASPYKIPTGSMIPTLKIGDFIFVSKLSYGLKLPFTNITLWQYSKPKKGDVIVFPFPDNPELDYIKRVVGVSGDTIEVRDHQLYLNNVAVPNIPISSKKYLYDQGKDENLDQYSLYKENLDSAEHIIMQRRTFIHQLLNFPPYTVPQGHVFAMGDNRDNSQDSRFWRNTTIPIENIRGKAMFVWISLDWENPMTTLVGFKIPSIRSHRFGMSIK